jgi:predicted CopG family antitoxin
VYVYVYTMATKTITVTEEAYERLREMKREDESFTDVLLRMTGGDEDVMKGFGAWKDTGLRDEVETAREELNEDFEGRQDELFGH